MRLSRYGQGMVGGPTMAEVTRSRLLSDLTAVRSQMVAAGLEPGVSEDVLDVFADHELALLIKDWSLRLARYLRLEAEGR